MPTETIRPDSTLSSVGFSQAGDTIYETLSDNNTATEINQNAQSSTFTVTLGNLSVSSATINNVKVTMVAQSNGRASEVATTVRLLDGSGTISTFALEPYGTADMVSIQSSAITQNSGGGALSVTDVNNFSVRVDPDTSGINISELFVIVDYSLIIPTQTYNTNRLKTHIKSGNTSISSGNIFI